MLAACVLGCVLMACGHEGREAVLQKLCPTRWFVYTIVVHVEQCQTAGGAAQ